MNVEGFHVLGITSAEAAYKVCWSLNQALNIHLVIHNSCEENNSPIYYKSESSIPDRPFYLVMNKLEIEGGVIPFSKTLKMVDYFLLLPKQIIEEYEPALKKIREVKIQVIPIPTKLILEKEWARIELDEF